MSLLWSVEKYYGDRRGGDVEIQRSRLSDDLKDMLRECWSEAAEHAKRTYENRPLAYNGYRYEIVTDGAGVRHYNLYTYWTDVSTQPVLNPRNMNEAPVAVLGGVVDDATLQQMAIGGKEVRF